MPHNWQYVKLDGCTRSHTPESAPIATSSAIAPGAQRGTDLPPITRLSQRPTVREYPESTVREHPNDVSECASELAVILPELPGAVVPLVLRRHMDDRYSLDDVAFALGELQDRGLAVCSLSGRWRHNPTIAQNEDQHS